jgi:adenine-specific DNA-methyltransferase
LSITLILFSSGALLQHGTNVPFDLQDREEEEAFVPPSLPRYETDQLISIVGGKRPVADRLRLILSSLAPAGKRTLFLDPFCGSGIVSRIARSLGMDVRACDLEPFSYIVNHVYLSLDNGSLARMFPDMGGLDAYFSMLHLEGLYAAESGYGLSRPYLSRYYAPSSDETYDGKRERLFFTAANARYLDTVREEIETGWLEQRLTAPEKAVVLAAILHEASRRANTSGTFTAYHKQFHRGGKAIRTRIIDRCALVPPMLPDEGTLAGEMHLCEASEFVKRYRADICYIDPPATVHQYGSAYHLLNSITLWDRYAPSDAIGADGALLDKAGIRKDWKRTHSPFCSVAHADRAFIHLIDSIDARHIVLTYPSNSLVSAERIHELLMARNAPVTVVPLPKRNQGGRQGTGGKNNLEQVFITGKSASLSLPIGEGLSLLPIFARLDTLLGVVFKHALDIPPFSFIGSVVLDGLPPVEELFTLGQKRLRTLVEYMEKMACEDEKEALTVLLLACAHSVGVERARLEKRMFSLLRQHLEVMDRHGIEQQESRFFDLLDNYTDGQNIALRKRLSSFFTSIYDTLAGKKESDA